MPTRVVRGRFVFEHRAGDPMCSVDRCDGGEALYRPEHGARSPGYPRRCPCGGLIHLSTPEEGPPLATETWCDRCGVRAPGEDVP